jgi:hypothetical protein
MEISMQKLKEMTSGAYTTFSCMCVIFIPGILSTCIPQTHFMMLYMVLHPYYIDDEPEAMMMGLGAWPVDLVELWPCVAR